jgi:hypothetical protein
MLAVREQVVRVTLVVQALLQATLPKVVAVVAQVPLEATEMLEEAVEAMVVLELHHPYQAQALLTQVVVVVVRFSPGLLQEMVVLAVVVRVVLTVAQQAAQAQVLQRRELQTQAAVAVVTDEM